MVKISNRIANALRWRIQHLLFRYGDFLSDVTYTKIIYRLNTGKRLNLRHPQTFSEKLQWLKLYDHNPLYTTLVDKYAVKDYVASKIGVEYIIPTLGVWNSVEEIEWGKLPNQFVLKTTQGGGGDGIVICRDRATFDRKKAIRKLEQAMKTNPFKRLREWPYKNVPHRIIAEKYMEVTPDVKDLPDYKWFCFNGEPKYCQVIQSRSDNETIDFFDTEWNHQDFIGLNPFYQELFKNADIEPAIPVDLKEQIRIARKLSKDIPFCRIDLYSINAHTWFGEVTFYPAGGISKFTPDNYNEIIGDMIDIGAERAWL